MSVLHPLTTQALFPLFHQRQHPSQRLPSLHHNQMAIPLKMTGNPESQAHLPDRRNLSRQTSVADEKTIGVLDENSFSSKISVTRRGIITSVDSPSRSSNQSTASFWDVNNSMEKMYWSKYSSTIFKSYSGIMNNSPSKTNSSSRSVDIRIASFPISKKFRCFFQSLFDHYPLIPHMHQVV